MSYFWKPEGPATEIEQRLAERQFDPGAGWFAKTRAKQAFDLYTTVGMIAHETSVASAEKAAGVYNEDAWMSGWYAGEEVPNASAMTKEDFEAKGYGRDGRIPWKPGTTEVRAKIEADEFDKRQHDNEILERTSTRYREALGFGAALIASLADPINLIPVGGMAAKGASIGRRAYAGAKAGLLGTAAADAVILPAAKARGEDVGFGTMALDLTFGALIGGGIGIGSHALHYRRVRSLASEEEALGKAFADAGFDAAEASRRAHDVVNVLADTAQRKEKVDAVRSWLGGQNREDAGRLLDRAMAALVRGEDMDVASWAALLRGHEPVNGESLLPRGVAPGVQRTFAEMLSAVEKDGVPQVNFGALSRDRLAALQAVERTGSMDIVRDGSLVLPSNVVWGLFSKGKGVLSGHHTADQLADALLEAVRFDRNAPVPAGESARAKRLTKLQDKLLETGFLERDKETGKVRINAETSLGSERKRLVEEMVAAGQDRDKAKLYANLHTAQALAFQKAYGVDAVKALKRRNVSRTAGEPQTGRPLFTESALSGDGMRVSQEEALRLDGIEGGAARKRLLRKAKKMLKDQNGDASGILEKTGWERTEDGNWAYHEKGAQEKIEQESEAWSKRVDEIVDELEALRNENRLTRENVNIAREQLLLNTTPLALRLIGVPFKKIFISLHTFDGIFPELAKAGQHSHEEISKDVLKKIPKALTDPLAIWESFDPETRTVRSNEYVVLLNIDADDGNKVLLPVMLNGRPSDRSEGTLTIIKSAYSAKDKNQTTLDVEAFKNMHIRHRDLRYINTGLWDGWGVPSHLRVGQSSTSAAVRAAIENLLTEKDLVKLRREHPTFYQDGPAGAQIPRTAGAEALTQGSQVDAVNRLFQEAWHGTPYQFDRFTLDHVGTGEGAQAHGHGLYFAAGRDVAEGYRERLSGKGGMRLLVDGIEYLGEAVDALTHGGRGVLWRDAAGDFVPEELVQHLDYLYRKAQTGEIDADYVSALKEWATGEGLTQDQRALLERFSREYESAELSAREEQGQLYRVEIPDNDVLLVEEGRLESQPQAVKEALATAREELGIDLNGSGRDVYEAISKALGGAEEASHWLNEHSVKGITYEGQRDGRCFVVFDDEAIKIYETLYQAKTQAQAGDAGPRGMVDFSSPEPGSMEETYRIFLAPDADASTIPHESAHIFLRELETVVANAGDGVNIEQARADLAALRRYAGVAEEGKLSEADYRTLQEAVARGFEQYLAEGRAPNAALEGAFRRMARWLSSIYEDIKAYVAGTDGVQLNDDVRRVFDRMLDPDRWGPEGRGGEFRMEGPRPDYSKPAPRPEIVPDTVEALERANDDILADMGHSPVDYEATRIVEAGQASPEHLQMLNEAQAALERVDKIEEASLAALECIIGAVA